MSHKHTDTSLRAPLAGGTAEDLVAALAAVIHAAHLPQADADELIDQLDAWIHARTVGAREAQITTTLHEMVARGEVVQTPEGMFRLAANAAD